MLLYVVLGLRARTNTSPLCAGDTDAVVNITSYGYRTKRVYLAIESIARGRVLPARIILWLDAEDWEAGRNRRSIRRLVARGLEVRQGVKEYRAHNKYFHFARSSDAGFLVTADDDVFYPRNWLAALWRVFDEGGRREVVAHWVRHPLVIDDDLAPSWNWNNARDTKPRVGPFTLGVSGVIFPPTLRRAVSELGTRFLESSALNDDVWISWNALRVATPVRQCEDKPLSALVIPFTQKYQLAHENIHNRQTELQLRATYGRADIKRIESLEQG